MIIATQFLVVALVVLSIILVVIIPTSLATKEQWEQSKSLIFLGSGLWAGLVFLTGFVSSLIS
uniref:photosystem II protein Z n=1 Tax=Dixoniella grisea TaxID=35153 RepID=UPI001FCE2013|nr:photosystem II protein Z [Dixoniella grisea]UNJ17113.1 photosystem II protein Z [Dixoniella grisea]